MLKTDNAVRGYFIMAAELTEIHPDTIAEILGSMDWCLQEKTEDEAIAAYEAFVVGVNENSVD